ncbi:MAG: winged helix-turn-helix transcriptional regulator [Fibrobacteria bacterium]|nr:winged helix-turn-helix transcriptional regulator [Fibrobacteria bacterium]
MKTDLENNVDLVAALLKSMSHPVRLRILCQLRDGEKTAGELQSVIKTTNANITQHLNIMRNQGCISSRKEANYIYSSISNQKILTLINTLQTLFCEKEK